MTALGVVASVNIVKGVRSRIVKGCIDSPADAFVLEQLEKALGHCVVVAVATAANAADQVVVAQEGLPLVADELTALIGMSHDRRMQLGAP